MAGIAPHSTVLACEVAVCTFGHNSHLLPQIHKNYGFCELAAPPKGDPAAASPKFSSTVGQGCIDVLVAGWRLPKVFESRLHRLAGEVGLLREASGGTGNW